MYADAEPASCLAAELKVAEVNARVAALLAARQAAAAAAAEAVMARGARPKHPAEILMVQMSAPEVTPADGTARLENGPDEPTPSCSREDTPLPESERRSRWWLIRNLVCLGCSFMVLYIAMKGAVNLQSSVNAEVGRGTAGLSAYYAGFLFSNIFLPTVFIRWLGCKVTVIVTILMYIPYIAAQLWAEFYTLVPGGLLAGLAAGPMWVAQGTYLSHMAAAYGERSDDSNDVLMVRLFGVFYMLYQMSQVWGNLLSSIVLSQGETASIALNDTRQLCGARFCPASAESRDQLAQSKPDPHHIAIITFTYIACIVLGAAIVYFGVDPIPRLGKTSKEDEGDNRKEEDTRTSEERNYGSCGELERSIGLNSSICSTTTTISTVDTLATSMNMSINRSMNMSAAESGRGTARGSHGATGGHGGHGGHSGESAIAVLSATLRLTLNLDLLLLVPITTFLGVEDTFLASEYTASYVSCAWGISNIGYVMICYGICNSTASVIGGWIVKVTGRVPVVLGATVLQVAVVMGLRIWQPHPNDTTLFFIMAGMWGATDGIWQAQINAMYGILFPGKEEAAYSSFRLWEGVGYVIAYSYSSFLCTDHKLYALLALLSVGIAGYLTTELRERKRRRNKLV